MKPERVGLLVDGSCGNVYRRANKTVYPTFAPAASTSPTADPSDRAHDCRDAVGDMLVPAAQLSGATARRYPACALTARRVVREPGPEPGTVVERTVGLVSFESAADALHQRECRLASMGFEQFRTVPVAAAVQRAMAGLEAARGRQAARDLVRPRMG